MGQYVYSHTQFAVTVVCDTMLHAKCHVYTVYRPMIYSLAICPVLWRMLLQDFAALPPTMPLIYIKSLNQISLLRFAQNESRLGWVCYNNVPVDNDRQISSRVWRWGREAVLLHKRKKNLLIRDEIDLGKMVRVYINKIRCRAEWQHRLLRAPIICVHAREPGNFTSLRETDYRIWRENLVLWNTTDLYVRECRGTWILKRKDSLLSAGQTFLLA